MGWELFVFCASLWRVSMALLLCSLSSAMFKLLWIPSNEFPISHFFSHVQKFHLVFKVSFISSLFYVFKMLWTGLWQAVLSRVLTASFPVVHALQQFAATWSVVPFYETFLPNRVWILWYCHFWVIKSNTNSSLFFFFYIILSLGIHLLCCEKTHIKWRSP